MTTLRPYQAEAISALYDWFGAGKGNPLVVAPTGSGKSVILAEFVRRAVTEYPATRVAVVTHVKELIAQNHAALLRLWRDAPAGIYSAGLNKRQIGRQITFCGVQSVARKAAGLGHIDLMIIDEAHLVPRSSDTLYGKLIKGLRGINPAMKVVGLTATPYRLDSGVLHEGDGALFDGIAYDIPVAMLVEEGYLAPLVSKRPGAVYDTQGLHTRAGDFIESEMAARFVNDELIRRSVAEIIALGADRRSWLTFCISVDHARQVRDVFRESGIACEMLTGDTPAPDRDRLIRSFREGRLRCLTNVNVLTTGFDAPATDLLAFLRPTQSTGLYVQMAGRGMRIAEGKRDCLVLDFAGNVVRHGPVDAIDLPVKKPKGGDGEIKEAPGKVCPECSGISFIAARECAHCGYLWPAPEPKHEETADTAPIMRLTAVEEWFPVQDIAFDRHRKPGSPDSVRVEYLIGGQVVREWLCFEHGGYARERAVRWWRQWGRGLPVPDTVDEALAMSGDLLRPEEATIERDGKFRRLGKLRGVRPGEMRDVSPLMIGRAAG